MLIWALAYLVDNEKNECKLLETHGDYEKYIDFLLESINKSSKLTEYKMRSNKTEVVSCVIDIMNNASELSTDGLEGTDKQRNLCKIIAKRFLTDEINAQKDVERMDVDIKSGCLMQALVKENDNYKYLIAKLDYSTYLQKLDLDLSEGIEVNKKRLGKSCLFNFEKNMNVMEISNIQVMLDNTAKYFTNKFLEMDPLYSDEQNTETMSAAVVHTIDQCFKKKYPQERLLLKNAFIHHLQTHPLIDYQNIREEIFTKFFAGPLCQISEEDQNKFNSKIAKLPEAKKFSRQFNCIPSKIKNRIIQNRYELTPFVNLELKQDKCEEEELFESIQSGEETDGRTYLKIYTNDQEALSAFTIRNFVQIENNAKQ